MLVIIRREIQAVGRICGYIGSKNGSEHIKAFLSGCYPLTKPDIFQDSYHVREDVALGTEGKGNLFQSTDGRYACVVDGRTYATRAVLEKITPDGPGPNPLYPAQVILYYYLQEGIKAFNELSGGFVFAIWDGEEKKLVLGRDRWGIKRIYYAKTQDGFCFSSNLVGLVSTPGFDKKIGSRGFIDYMSYGFIHPPNTIYENVFVLNPGEFLIFDGAEVKVDHFHPLVPDEWAFHDTTSLSEKELVDRLDSRLIDSVNRRLPEGPEVATYLSSGLDTSLVCSILTNHTNKRVIAYTLGSNDPNCDEVPDAREIAKHLGVDDHRSHYIKKEDFLEALFSLPLIYGQPFGDISAIPNYVIAKNVAQGHDAVFAGDGPDFMYCGVDFRLWDRYYRMVPYLLRIPLSAFFSFVFRTFYKKMVSPNIFISELLRQPEFFWIFHKKFKSYELERLIRKKVDPQMFWLRNYLESRKDIPPYERFRLAFFIVFGTHGVLYKGSDIHDILRMDFICPYYEAELFDFVQFLPTEYKFRDGKGKYLHKQLLFRYVPRELLERPKHGVLINYNEFGLDILRDLTNKYLSRKRLDETGLVNADYALRCVEGYYRGDLRMGPLLWTLLVFELWRDKFSS